MEMLIKHFKLDVAFVILHTSHFSLADDHGETSHEFPRNSGRDPGRV